MKVQNHPVPGDQQVKVLEPGDLGSVSTPVLGNRVVQERPSPLRSSSVNGKDSAL